MGQGVIQREAVAAAEPVAPPARLHHHGVRGSAALSTRPLALGAVAAEALEPGEMRRLPFDGELLGAARVRSAFVAVPLDAFDEAAPALPPEVQAAYFHLLRLSYGEGRNYCRAAKRELQLRLHVSERRLLRLLDVLAERGLLRPLHRDNRGTLWRVYLPREAAGQQVGDEVLLGRPSPVRAAPAPVTPAPKHRPEPVERARPASAKPTASRAGSAAPDARALAAALAGARGEAGEDALRRAAAEVQELLGEGQTPARVAAAIETIRRRAERSPAGPGGAT